MMLKPIPRFRGRKRMTICIGLIASDGIVIAADAQESDTYFKISQQKIMTWHTSSSDGHGPNPAAYVIAGAGDGGFVDSFVDEMWNGVRGDMTMPDFKRYAGQTLERFYLKHVRPLVSINESNDFSVLIGAYFGFGVELLVSHRSTLRRVQAPVTAIGLGAQYALSRIENYPCSDVRHSEVTAASVLHSTKDCIEGCGKYSDIVSIHLPKFVEGDADTSSRLEHPPQLWTRVPSKRVEQWESKFSNIWRVRQLKLYNDLIEEELKPSDFQT
jgi:hypothetical protein